MAQTEAGRNESEPEVAPKRQYAGKPHLRFYEGPTGARHMAWLVRHSQKKWGAN